MERCGYKDASVIVVEECRLALESVDVKQVRDYIDLIQSANRVFFVGVGRVLLSLEAIAKRYAHIGIATVVVGQITEPAITTGDVLLVGSGSGESLFPLGIAKKAKSIGAKVIHIGSNPESSMFEYTDVFVRIPAESRKKLKDEIHSQQPMTSLFEQVLLLFGDTTAMMMIREKNIDIASLWQYHANLE